MSEQSSIPSMPSTPSGASQRFVKRRARGEELRSLLRSRNRESAPGTIEAALRVSADDGWLEYFVPGIETLWRSPERIATPPGTTPWALTTLACEKACSAEANFALRLAALLFWAEASVEQRMTAISGELLSQGVIQEPCTLAGWLQLPPHELAMCREVLALTRQMAAAHTPADDQTQAFTQNQHFHWALLLLRIIGEAVHELGGGRSLIETHAKLAQLRRAA